MPTQFNSYIETVDTDFWRDLCLTHGELRHYEKGEEFIKAGTVGKYFGYIVSGALKYVCFSPDDNTPHVIGLEFAGQFVCDFPFSLFKHKSRSSIIATTPCDIYCIPSAWVAERMKTDEKLREIVAYTTSMVFATLYDRYVDLYTKSPQTRYEELIRNDANLFSLFSLQDIASILNISPTHLSRLRKKK